MKRLCFAMAAMLFLAMFFVGCNKTAAEIDIIGISEITVDGDTGMGTVVFTTNKAWTASCQEDWVHLDPSSGYASYKNVTMTVTCDRNPSNSLPEGGTISPLFIFS